jgi:SOS response regulatory protein OraA/RecX
LCEAIRRGLNLLSYGAQSERTLCRKLHQRGIDEETAAEAAAYLRQLGLMDESADAERIVAACRRKRWGMRRILSHLFEKGYPEAVIREMQSMLEGEDFVPDCVALIRSKWHEVPTDRHERQKMTASLMRYGFSNGEIRRAMERVAREDAEN